MIAWGNHSASQYPDLSHATAGGRPAAELVDEHWPAEADITRDRWASGLHIDASVAELVAERDALRALGLI